MLKKISHLLSGLNDVAQGDEAMKKWITTLAEWLIEGSDCVLITIAKVEGSTPREAGASMIVKRHDQSSLNSSQDSLSNHGLILADTIGGGHLEWLATQIAHDMLTADETIRLERFNLGARLGQCCGGVAWVVFEKIQSDQAEFWQHHTEQMNHQGLTRLLTLTDTQSVWQERALDHLDHSAEEVNLQHRHNNDWQFQQTITHHRFSVVIFGGGHVGQAVVNTLLPLQAHIRWVDIREDIFPKLEHPSVVQIVTDSPEAEIYAAPANTYFLIMTHNHALDLSLCLALFKRNDFSYFGLIGSRSKRVVFERRLAARGVSQGRLSQMICPIGIQGVTSKEPAVIAASVTAQLLQYRYGMVQNNQSTVLNTAAGQN